MPTLYKNVNLADPRQDVHSVRRERPSLNRFRVAEKLISESEPDASVLELGGGAAEFSQRLLARGFKVTFVDLSETNVQRAQKLGMEAHQLDLNDGLPGFANSQFDGVVMLEIIEHVVAAEQLLSEAARVLKPGGFLILSTPNFAYWLNRLRILAGYLSCDEGYHFRFFTPSILERRLTTAGLRVDRIAHTTPALGYNFIANRLAGKPRLHVRVPRFVAPVLAHTLFVRARKPAID